MDNKEKTNGSLFESFSRNDTFEYAKKLAEGSEPGQVFCLSGDLGVGKTVFAQGFGAGLGIEEPMASPTFTIVHEYTEGRLPLYHFDVYRLSDVDEFYAIGGEEYFSKGESLNKNTYVVSVVIAKKNVEPIINEGHEEEREQDARNEQYQHPEIE